MQGEVSTGGRGAGQELYSVEPYAPGSDAKDVMWKRLARSHDESMQVRVREASAKATVSLLMTFGTSDLEERVRYADLAAEAAAQLGKKLVSFGVTVELGCRTGGEVSSVRGTSPAELAAAIVDMWSRKSLRPYDDAALARTDLLVLDQDALKEERIAGLVRSKPVLLVRTQRTGQASWGRLFTFTGNEDLTPLTEVLLEA